MGLDIKAVKNARLVGETKDYDEYEEKYYPQHKNSLYAHPCYVDGVDAAAGVVSGGVYTYDESVSFRAGSYGGYNEWRNTLSVFAYEVPAETVWKNENRYKDKPFWRLINFSDCEGIIGSEWCKKLAADFAQYQDAFFALELDDWYKEKYADWRKAFEMAADGGFVDFL